MMLSPSLFQKKSTKITDPEQIALVEKMAKLLLSLGEMGVNKAAPSAVTVKASLQNSVRTIGFVDSISDGVVNLRGVTAAGYGEVVNIVAFQAEGVLIVPALVLNLAPNKISAVALRNLSDLTPGMYACKGPSLLSVTVGEALLGRIVNPLGEPLDSKGALQTPVTRALETRAPSIISRSPVNVSLETGLKVVDSLVPIGHGQRELIIGDAKIGKTSIAIDTILNQKNKDVICVYVSIGQKLSEVARIAHVLESHGSLSYTVLVAATAATPAALQYVAPYSGCAIGEYFMSKGLRSLVVYDDLSKHAVSYRQLSLLLRRPPGREGYPGDVFYLHSRLLERAANLSQAGSLTALPIIETIQGDVSAYIPTNVISITDGQIFLETELFTKGIRPAVSPGLSVSRVGSAAQNKTMKKMAGNLKLELAQYREVEDFTKLGFALDEATKKLVDRGEKLTRLLVQPRYSPIDVVDQMIFLYAALNGFLDGIPLDSVARFEQELYAFVHSSKLYEPLAYSLRNNLDTDLLSFVLLCFRLVFRNYVL
jgi:F-type H+/Na+-transporting ATPase subunit alpha